MWLQPAFKIYVHQSACMLSKDLTQPIDKSNYNRTLWQCCVGKIASFQLSQRHGQRVTTKLTCCQACSLLFVDRYAGQFSIVVVRYFFHLSTIFPKTSPKSISPSFFADFAIDHFIFDPVIGAQTQNEDHDWKNRTRITRNSFHGHLWKFTSVLLLIKSIFGGNAVAQACQTFTTTPPSASMTRRTSLPQNLASTNQWNSIFPNFVQSKSLPLSHFITNDSDILPGIGK